MHLLRFRPTRFPSCFLLMAVCLAALVWTADARAADYAVTNLNDSGAGSLRDAVSNAADGDRIVFAPGLSGTVTLSSAMSPLNSIEFVNAQGVKLSMPNGDGSTHPLDVGRAKTISGFLPGNITTRGTGQPSAIYGLGSLTFAEKVSGTIAATSSSAPVPAIIAMGDIVFEKDLSGSILAQSSRAASGIYTGGLLRLKSLSGSIETIGISGGGMEANYVTILDDLSGSIVAVMSGDHAYGIYSFRYINIGSLSGSIFASTKGSKAKGVYAEAGDLNINGPLSGTIAASAGTSEAYGLYSIRNMTLGDVSGDISAGAASMGFGILTGKNLKIDGDVSGSVSAVAKGSHAQGVYSGQTTRINGDVSGSISASAGSVANAFQTEGFLLNGKMSGSLVATAIGNYAIGIGSLDTLTLNGVLSGSVDATAQNQAYGLKAIGTMTFNNGLTGSVTAVARDDLTYGIFTEKDIALSGGLSGTVSAAAGGAYAYSLSSLWGKIDGNGVPLDISGTVSATAQGRAVAIFAPQGMNLNVTGSLLATDSSGSGEAYAIRAGTYDLRTQNWIPGGAVNDTVVLGDGANVLGKIDLGGGTNLLNLDGAGSLSGDVSNITTMTKTGAGTWSTSGDIATNDLTVQGGMLTVNVAQPNTPTVQVANNFTNNGEVAFTLGGLVQSGQSFTALTSANLAGTGTYSSSSPLLSVSVAGNNVNLTKKSYMDAVGSGNVNAVALAAVLDPLTATATGDMANVIEVLERSASQQEFNENLNELSGLLASGATSMSLGTAQQLSIATQTRMAQIRTYQTLMAHKAYAPDPEDPESWPMVASNGDMAGIMHRSPEVKPNGVHLRMLGRTGNMDTHGGYDGYDYRSMIISGGFDRVLNDDFLVGISGGYAQTDADYKDAGNSESTLDSYSLGFYGTWFDDRWYVDALIAGAYNKYDMTRNIPAFGRTAKSDSTGYTVSAKNAAGYRFDVGDYALTPNISLEYTRFHQDGYTESGAGAVNLSLPDVDSNFLESGLGITVDRAWQTDFGQIIPEVSAMWMHEWLTQNRALTVSMTGMPGTVFSQTTAETARDSYRFGAGVRAIHNEGMSLSLRYQGDVEEYAASHSLMCEAQFVF